MTVDQYSWLIGFGVGTTIMCLVYGVVYLKKYLSARLARKKVAAKFDTAGIVMRPVFHNTGSMFNILPISEMKEDVDLRMINSIVIDDEGTELYFELLPHVPWWDLEDHMVMVEGLIDVVSRGGNNGSRASLEDLHHYYQMVYNEYKSRIKSL